MILILHDVNI